MKTLKIDDKWSVEYDPMNNDRPVTLLRHGQRGDFDEAALDSFITRAICNFLSKRQKET